MKRVLSCMMVLLISVMTAPVYAAVIGTTDAEVKNIVEPMLDNVLKGFSKDDYFLYAQDFDGKLKETITAERFQEIRQDVFKGIGAYLYREYLGFINKGSITIIFWKGVFDKTQDEMLIKMIVTRENGQYLITDLVYQ